MTVTGARLPISVFIQTKNEELAIRNCVSRLSDFAEVKVIDSISVDDTKALAQAEGAEVVDFDWNGRYPKKKQWQLDHVRSKYEWILFLDADEYPTAELVVELCELFRRPDELVGIAAFDISLAYRFAGRLLRHGHRVKKRALVHRERVGFPVLPDLDAPGMGELEGHYQPVARGSIRALRGRIVHDDPDPVGTWFSRHNKYSDWEAFLAYNSAVGADRYRSGQGRLFSKVPFKPAVFFFYSYLLRLGFLDGRAGLDYAIALSSYYWQIGLKYRELIRQGF